MGSPADRTPLAPPASPYPREPHPTLGKSQRVASGIVNASLYAAPLGAVIAGVTAVQRFFPTLHLDTYAMRVCLSAGVALLYVVGYLRGYREGNRLSATSLALVMIVTPLYWLVLGAWWDAGMLVAAPVIVATWFAAFAGKTNKELNKP